jgi:threonine/homoserine/homoserine lactone efflux protein
MAMFVHIEPLIPVYLAYLLATASPGPSNMAIMGVAMTAGRMPALCLAAGVVSGSMFWAMMAAIGMATLLASYAQALTAIKIAGGLYLIYLAWKSTRAALAHKPPGVAAGDDRKASTSGFGTLYLRGLMLHLTNPKAILAWIAIMSLGLGEERHAATSMTIILGCAVLGVSVFGGYALAFSTRSMVSLYARSRRWIEAALAVFFAFAGIRLLTARI